MKQALYDVKNYVNFYAYEVVADFFLMQSCTFLNYMQLHNNPTMVSQLDSWLVCSKPNVCYNEQLLTNQIAGLVPRQCAIQWTSPCNVPNDIFYEEIVSISINPSIMRLQTAVVPHKLLNSVGVFIGSLKIKIILQQIRPFKENIMFNM